MEGVIETYRNMLLKIQFSGPTHFHHLIKFANEMAESVDVNQDEY
jgi:hypothetical protein